MMKSSMLYLMHVDWGWAKQRPHFVAEGLAKYFDVAVRFVHSFDRKLVSKAMDNDQVGVGKIYRFPLARFAAVRKLNEIVGNLQLLLRVRSSSMIWVTHPVMFSLIRGSTKDSSIVIYDCMDDVLEFPDAKHDPAKRRAMERLERALIKRADIVYSSSNYLKSKLQDRYAVDSNNIHVVNNGIHLAQSGAVIDPVSETPLHNLLGRAFDATGKRMVYIGTIAEWFDFDLVLKTLNEMEDVSYVIVGPCEIEPPKHERLFVVPPVKHHDVARIMQWADALVMPFQLTELIRSVNPVKVYEYIHAGKPSVVLRYGETEAFAPYVYLYGSEQEYLQIMADVVGGTLPARADRVAAERFVTDSSWGARVDEMVARIPLN